MKSSQVCWSEAVRCGDDQASSRVAPTLSGAASRGFTLVEMFIAIAIVGIIASIAVPTFKDFIETYRVDSNLRGFTSALKFAQSEAIKRAQPVTMCVEDIASATPDCDTTVADGWERGWIIFRDLNGDGVVDIDPDEDLTDVVLRQQVPIDDLRFFTNPDVNRMTFSGTGALQAGGNVTFLLCQLDSSNAACSDNESYTSEIRSFASGALVFVGSK